jgi:hypothetical protein
MYSHLPGGDILETGLRDLRRGVRSINALLLLVGAPRLARSGIAIPQVVFSAELPEHELYRQLCREQGPEAYRHYRALLRRLASLEHALDLQAAANAATRE